MSRVNFAVPLNFEELLTRSVEQYYVQDVLSLPDVSKALKAASTAYRDIGPSFIFESFDTFYSVLHLHNQLPKVVVHGAFEDLHKTLKGIKDNIIYYMDEEDKITEDVKLEMQNVIKMIIYLYITSFSLLELSSEELSETRTKRHKPNNANSLKINWSKAIIAIRSIFELPLHKFWDSGGVDSALLDKTVGILMTLLEATPIKTNKEAQTEIFTLLGVLLVNYDIRNLLVIRLARIVKENEFTVSLVADGLKGMIKQYDVKEFLVAFIVELTEWQLQEENIESNAIKHCTRLVIELAERLPEHLQEMLDYLEKYLRADSFQLRIMVLGVQTEVLEAGTLIAETLMPPEKKIWVQMKFGILHTLEQFTSDFSAAVRGKVFGYIARLKQGGAVPENMMMLFFKKAVKHLSDLTASVRKAAAACVTIFLQHNTFGPSLSYEKISQMHSAKREELNKFKYDLCGIDMEKLEQLEQEWAEHVPGLSAEVQLMLNNDEQNNEDERDQSNQQEEDQEVPAEADTEDTPQSSQDLFPSLPTPPASTSSDASIDELIRDEISARNYKLAVDYLRTAVKTSKILEALRERVEITDEQFYLCYLHLVFSNIGVNSMSSHPPPTVEELSALSQLEHSVDSLSECLAFLEENKTAMYTMCDMVNSVNLSDLHEAVEYFTTANKFKLDSAIIGIDELLKVLLRNEEDRRNCAGTALKTIFLVTDATDLVSHTTQIVDNLISLYKTITSSSMDAFASLITLWSSRGVFGNDVIDTLWGYFLLKYQTTPQNARVSLCLLQLATHGRYTIIERNYRVIENEIFGKRGMEDPLLLVEGLDMLCMLKKSETCIDKTEPAFRIAASDSIWTKLFETMKFYKEQKTPVVNNIIASAVRFIFAMHKDPFIYMESLLELFMREEIEKLNEKVEHVKLYQRIRYNILVGEMAVNMLNLLDSDIYQELKRRQTIKQAKNGKVQGANTSTLKHSSARKQKNQDLENASLNKSTAIDKLDESLLQGADAMDEDADFVSHVLDKSLDLDTLLGKLFAPIIYICKNPTRYTNPALQFSAVTALARAMLLSNPFCNEHIHLIFTVLMRTPHVRVKVAILIHIVDFLERSPNIVDPYTPKLYDLLEDENPEVRQAALNTLSLLIIKDMIRPQGDIWRLAVCLVDDDKEICDIARTFFLQSTDKNNNLYNYMPDMFTTLSAKFARLSNTKANENEAYMDENEHKFQTIMKYLIHLIDKSKQIEVLVERFCLKFDNADEPVAVRVSFVLSLLTYNDRALQKLADNFPKYKHFILVDEVYSWMKAIFANCKGRELKEIVTQLEEMVKEMFTVDGPPKNFFKKPVPPKRKAVNGKGNPRTPAKRKGKSKKPTQEPSADSSSDSDDDIPVKKGRTIRRLRSIENL